ncbi:MAG: hypothetical protein JXB47_17935 [Anaerolineae bacterium]|nr:hypothetical protein [Anaerolineae bacterium]
MAIHIFGIRHHGPGSARSLARALDALKPDAVLVEGPPDADPVIPLLGCREMQPPVALLVYVPDTPRLAAYYPFAAFSPEWQAIDYSLASGAAVRFMDLPQAHQLAVRKLAEEEAAKQEAAPPAPGNGKPPEAPAPAELRGDPLALLAQAAGYSDGERWWEHMVEQRRDSAELFDAILEMMTALRTELGFEPENPFEAMREAHMRKTIRAAQKDGFERIAVVCGAWHAPALVEAAWPAAKADNAVLKGAPKIKVETTWVPWTHGRLSRASGYGAGIESPGWYHHLFTVEDQIVVRWMARVAHLLREEDLDASAAQVIDAVRLADALAALRDRPLPGLDELNEATQAVMCFGNPLPMRLIYEKLIVGEALGAVPDATPKVPLQRDLEAQQRSLRMKPDASQSEQQLDLRTPMHLARSHLLHRLGLLGIPWGKRKRVEGSKQGTFWEWWDLQWHPEFAVRVIEANMWGNTVFDAASAYAQDAANRAGALPELTGLLDKALLADLPDAASHVMQRVKDQAALSTDTGHLMDALPPLANILRYGNVRKTDAAMVEEIVDGLVARVCIGLPGACASLDDDAAEAMFKRLVTFHQAVTTLQNEDYTKEWRRTLTGMMDQSGLHGLVAGRATRLLMDAGAIDAGEAARRMGLALARAADPPQAAAWVEGFLRGSGLILLHDDDLWAVLDDWITGITDETFQVLLPLLRRTFSTFPPAERRQMGERVRRGKPAARATRAVPRSGRATRFEGERADKVLGVLGLLLGVGEDDED